MIRKPLTEWKREDYLEARDIITDTRKKLGIYTGLRMTAAEARRVITELEKAGEYSTAEYIETIYHTEFKEAANNGKHR